jgi:hypothetical protein
MIAVQGCRRDAFPSGMARDMGGGEVIYMIRPGQVARFDEAVDTLADAAVGELATIDEQRAYWEAWLQQRGKAWRLDRPHRVSAPWTLCESISAALGCGLRPSCRRNWARTTGRIFSVTLPCSHRLKYQYTVCQGGKSAGSCRHAHPVHTTYKIASAIARRGCFSGRPPVLTGGSSGSITAHCSLLVSEGYRDCRVTPPLLITIPGKVASTRRASQTRSQRGSPAFSGRSRRPRARGWWLGWHWVDRAARCLWFRSFSARSPAEPRGHLSMHEALR